jgi:ribonuclease PH
MPRKDGRAPADLRPIRFERRFLKTAPGAVLCSFGETRVLCTATWVDGVPPFLQNKGQGWLTAEYGMLPGSTTSRKQRDRNGKLDGRSVEIQRLIGRALRAVTDLTKLTERTLWIDCDVLQADGGTRTASITGAYVALVDCLKAMEKGRLLRGWPLKAQLGAVSVGVVDGEVRCDLDYAEDSQAEADANFVLTGTGGIVEIQGTAERKPFSAEQFDQLLKLATRGIADLTRRQLEAVAAR